MKEYVENLAKNMVPSNSGYIYIATENVAIPVHKVVIGISKRRTTNLELVEEMVLRFASIGINDIDTIASALGLPRDILDITVGDLHVKNLAFHSSGKCVLMAKGKDALKTLAVSKREKDVLQNIYVNAITGEISGEKSRGYTEGRVQNNEKMKHIIDANSIELYRRNMSSINLIFLQAMKTYFDDNMKVQDELVSVDSIDDLSTGYIVAPIHIYVSESGSDIDIIAGNRWQKCIIEDHKAIIIEQMRTRKLLNNLFVYKRSEYSAPSCQNALSCEEQYQMIQSLLSNGDIQDLNDKASKILLGPRKLFDNELLDFCRLIFSEAASIEIQIDDLNYWSKSSKFLTIGSYVAQNTRCRILYNSSGNNTDRPIQRIHNSCPNISEKEIRKGEHSAWLNIVVDSKIQVDVYCESIRVFSENQHIPHIIAFVSEYTPKSDYQIPSP